MQWSRSEIIALAAGKVLPLDFYCVVDKIMIILGKGINQEEETANHSLCTYPGLRGSGVS